MSESQLSSQVLNVLMDFLRILIFMSTLGVVAILVGGCGLGVAYTMIYTYRENEDAMNKLIELVKIDTLSRQWRRVQIEGHL